MKKTLNVLALVYTSFILLNTPAWAFPEMVRHGYVNCISCHVSPTGGGVLTEYGRELSKEILSTWSKDGEQAFIYGLIKPPEKVLLGGDFRGLELYKDNEKFTQAKFIFMQADLEAALNFYKFYLVSTFGYVDPSPPSSLVKDHFISRKHYLNYRPTDELSFRIGKFQYSYGINTAEHTTLTKRGLQIGDQGSETYNVESAWIGEKLNTYVTAIFGRPDARELKREQGGSITTAVAVADTYKIGASYLYARNETFNRHVLGPYFILGFTPKLFLLSEFDFQGTRMKGRSSRTWGFANYQRLNYEFTQGVHGYVTQELMKPDFSSARTTTKAYGLGMQFFPRPHFELDLSWQIQIDANSPGYTDYGFILFHFYL